MMVLAMLWWAWVCYAWLTSVIEPEEGPVRLVMFAVMAALLVVAYTIPEAFGDRALGFALIYGLVRLGHVALFVLVSRDDPVMRRSVLGFAIGTSIAIGLLVWASFLSGGAQVALWLIAILIDWGDGFFGVGNWRLVPAHFAERHNLIIILALGESVIALGIGVDLGFTGPVIAAAVLGIGLASALWWIYFDVVALVTERRLMAATRAGSGTPWPATPTPTCITRWWPGSCSAPSAWRQRWHTSIPHSTPAHVSRARRHGYLSSAHVALRLRNARTVNVERLVVAVLLFALIPVATRVDALTRSSPSTCSYGP